MKSSVLVTGGTGFVGTTLLPYLVQKDVDVYVLSRRFVEFNLDNIHVVKCDSIESYDGRGLPDKIDTIVHMAGLAHVEEDIRNRELYERINVRGTQAIANLAVMKGVEHFIFLSSIKVNGSSSSEVIFENHAVDPKGVYAESKYKAETNLKVLTQHGCKVSILRPPLVYGNGVKANMALLIKLVKMVPILPFGKINNRRSFVSCRNLSDLIYTLCFRKPTVDYQFEVFFASDGRAMSVKELCLVIAKALNKKVFLLPVPVSLLSAGMALIGKADMWQKLNDSLEVYPINANRHYGWKPPFSMQEEIRHLVMESKQ